LTSRTLQTSTPFPYTTLFRSPDPENERITETLTGVNPVLQELALGEHDDPSSREAAGDLSPPSVVRGLRLLPPDPPEFFGLGERDRKSTRLNSSHVKISYAVF